MKRKILWIIIGIIVIVILIGIVLFGMSKKNDSIKVGWIGAMTGPQAKYGSYEASILAVEDINNDGGINGKKLELVAEDGKCDPKSAVDATNKLIDVDKVKVIIGGHCSPESVAIAPIAEKNKIIMLASITGTPLLTNMGDYIFRTSASATVESKLLSNLIKNKFNLSRLAIIYEQTDYARPIAEKMRDEFNKNGGNVILFEAYTPGTSDFRTILTKVNENNIDSIFLDPQSPDAAFNLLKQINELGIKAKLFGNDVTTNQIIINQNPDLFEGFIAANPYFDINNSNTKKFIEKYDKKYNTNELPYGFWTAESYDGVMIVSDMIKKCGETDTDCMKKFLYGIKDYPGVSGNISIDENGDGVRTYSLNIVYNGTLEVYSQ
jgi:branched-chain amino acid transport system substrate-binding protein